MDWKSPDLPSSFKLFKQKVELYFTIKDIKREKQMPFILRAVNDEGLRRYNTWSLSEAEATDPNYVWKRFEEMLEPSENFRIARLKLHFFYQRPDEALDSFVTRCRAQALKCDFKNEQELSERIIEQIIASTSMPEYQKALLSQKKDYSLNDALTLGRTYEATQQNLQHLQDMSRGITTTPEHKPAPAAATPAIDVIRKKKNTREMCLNCGRDHPREREKCPAHTATCDACGKRGHWSRFCLTTKYKQKRGGQHRNQRSTSRNRNKNRSPSRDIHNLDFEKLMFESVMSNQQQRDQAFCTLKIKLQKPGSFSLKLKVDTGAQGNALPMRVFRRMFPDRLDPDGYPNNLEQKKVILTAYNGSQIPCYGVINIPCCYNEQWEDIEFYVVDVEGPAILGLPSCTKLKVVTLNCTVNTSSKKTINDVQDLMQMYPELFDHIGEFPGTAKLEVKPGAEPYIDPPRKWPIHLKDRIKQELDRMEQDGVIRKVEEHTDWCSSLAFSTKSDGSIRICLDPAKLNRSLKRCPHKIPTLEELNHRFSGAKYFSKLDAKAGYWSIILDQPSQLLTTFRTPLGRYCFCRLPFGLSVSQDIFQQRMDTILDQCTNAVGIADDICVFSKTKEEHNQHLLQLMEVARKSGLVFNSSKCNIKKSEISFFGMTYSRDGIKPDPTKINDLQAIPTPQCKKDLQTFLGLIQYLGPFIPHLSGQAAPLRQLLKDDIPFEWEDDHQHVFNQLKYLVSNDATLQYYDVNAPAILQVDASLRGLGAALLQPNSRGAERPIAYASKSLSDAETRYANIEREMLAVCYGVERFKTYLYGRKFKIITDHKPLVAILGKNLTSAPPRLQRMIYKLQGYNFTIEYRKGRDIPLPDSLSRLPNPANNAPVELDLRIDFLHFSDQKLQDTRDATTHDTDLAELRDVIVRGWPHTQYQLPESLRDFWNYRDELSVENGIILKGERVLIPEPMREDILKQLHTGHQGVEKTRLRAKTLVFWPKINAHIEQLCKSCDICQKHQTSQTHETLMQHDVPSGPWKNIAADIFEEKDTHNHYLLICDYYSKFPILKKLPDKCPSSTVVAIMKEVFAEHGIPNRLISDNGPHFQGNVFKQFTETWGFNHITSSPRYARSNGFIERQVRTVKLTLQKAREAKEDLHLSLLALRSTPLDHHLPSPAELLYQRKLATNIATKIRNMNRNKEGICQRFIEKQQTQKTLHDRRAKDLPQLQPGQPVTVFNPTSGVWQPANIIQQCSEPRSYLIQPEPHGGILRRNRHQLRERTVTFADENSKTNQDDYQHDKPHQTNEAQTLGREDQPGTIYKTRYGRTVKMPQRYLEVVNFNM